MTDWNGIIAIEGEATGDGRLFELGAFTWDTLPITLIWDRDEGDHSGMVVGSVTNIWRDGELIRAEGDLSDSDDPETRAAVTRVAELLTEGAVGVSVRFDKAVMETRVDPDLLAALTADLTGDPLLPVADLTRPWSAAAARNRVFEHFTDEDGNVDLRGLSRAFLWRHEGDPTLRSTWALGIADVVNDQLRIVPRAVRAATGDRGVSTLSLSDEERNMVYARVCRLYERIAEAHPDFGECPLSVEMVTVARSAHDDVIAVYTAARIRHLAIVDTAAFDRVRIGLVAAGALLAASAPFSASQGGAGAADPFADPGFGKDGHADPRLARQEPERPGESVTWGCPLTLTSAGLVYGHAALWGRCHSGFRDRCVIPPRNGDYSRFMHGEAAPGVRTGPLTVGTTHAKLMISATEAMDHYSNTGRAVADVVVGEDRHGLWVSGRLRPGVSERDLADLRGSSLSGDWRPVNGRYRLVGLLAVNQPGYLVQRAIAAAGAGVITAGPCSCDSESDPWQIVHERLDHLAFQLESLTTASPSE